MRNLEICKKGKVRFIWVGVFSCLWFLFSGHLKAVNEVIPAGSYIINMGVQPQTYENGLLPYGLVYKLLRFESIPVKWVINPFKVKDGIDFTYNGINYRGGPFIIEAQYRTPAVDAIISNFELAGVVGTTTTTPITVPVAETLKYYPVWTLDIGAGGLAEDYFANAKIPIDAYRWAYPSTITCCDDIFVLPHSDPNWTDHGGLLTWVKDAPNGGCNGWVWGGCRTGSGLENLFDPARPGNKLNFLSEDGLVNEGDHGNGTPAYLNRLPTDPVMQFMGTTDGAHEGGSEQIYLPLMGEEDPEDGDGLPMLGFGTRITRIFHASVPGKPLPWYSEGHLAILILER